MVPHGWPSSILSMLDKWEYPWYAAWDLAIHAIAFRLWISISGNEQSQDLLLRNSFLHPTSRKFPRTNGTSLA